MMFPQNTEIVRYDRETYAHQVLPAWIRQGERRNFENYGEKIDGQIKIFVAKNPEFQPGDFITIGAEAYPLAPDTLEDFLANFPHYKAEKVEIMRLPGGAVHHLEITAARYNI